MNAKTYTIGLDLGDRHHHACGLDAAGEIVAEEVTRPVENRTAWTPRSDPLPSLDTTRFSDSLVCRKQSNP